MPPPPLQPDTDYVRAYQALYGVTFRLATEYASLPPGDGGGGLNGNRQATAYGQALRDVCADNNATFGDANCIGKCAILEDMGTMLVVNTNYLLPGSLYGALVQINDIDCNSVWAQNEIAKLTALVDLFGWNYIGPVVIHPITVTDYVVDVGETSFGTNNFTTPQGIVMYCPTIGISINLTTGATGYGNIGTFGFSTVTPLSNPVVTMSERIEGTDFRVTQTNNNLLIEVIIGLDQQPLAFPILIQTGEIIGSVSSIAITGAFGL